MPDFSKEREILAEKLQKEGILKTQEVLNAFLRVPRELFVWPGMEPEAYWDVPLPLGDTGQTISAPHMVVIMLEELRVRKGMKVLEIGTGSGYNAALLAELVGPQGYVITIERVPELVDFAKKNLERAGYASRVKVILGDGSLGYPPKSVEPTYDRIIVTAAARKIPKYLIYQLKDGGILLIPVGAPGYQELTRVTKKKGQIYEEKLGGCVFVPLVGEDA